MLEKLTFGLLCAVAGWEVFRWIYDRRLKKDIEYLKAEFKRRETVHRVQFETEFSIYRELWQAVYRLKSLAPITPSADTGPGGDEQKRVYQDRLEKAFKVFEQAHSVVELNKPFYSPTIYTFCDMLNTDCLKHFLRIRRRLNTGKLEECYDMADSLIEKVKSIAGQIENAIRQRIGALNEDDIVG